MVHGSLMHAFEISDIVAYIGREDGKYMSNDVSGESQSGEGGVDG